MVRDDDYMWSLAATIYDKSSDMDSPDYKENMEQEIEQLESELWYMEEHCETVLMAIEMIIAKM